MATTNIRDLETTTEFGTVRTYTNTDTGSIEMSLNGSVKLIGEEDIVMEKYLNALENGEMPTWPKYENRFGDPAQ